MPKPNKYKGNGQLKPEGLHEGPYVMHKGKMVPDFRASDEAIRKGLDAFHSYNKVGRLVTLWFHIACVLGAMWAIWFTCSLYLNLNK